MTTLYVVATPIGNLQDLSPRALSVLKGVDVILCEDTRVTRKLLAHYDIHVSTMSYHAHSSERVERRVAELVRAGKNLALVSDAGTPAISDPGAKLVSSLRASFDPEELAVIAIPGPSALSAALSVSGLPASEFVFLGFLPPKKGRAAIFAEIASSGRTVVLYESPHRVLKTLSALKEHLDSSRKVVVSREISKIFEETVSGSPEEVWEYFHAHPEKVRGEFVVLIGNSR